MNINRVGIDLAKQVFQVHGVDCQGKAVLRKRLKRGQLLKFFATLPPCLVGMGACGGAHYWARELQNLGHSAKLMAPQFVKPYVKSNKDDANDAEATCEAVGRPTGSVPQLLMAYNQGGPNSTRLIYRPTTMLCIRTDFEKQMVRRARRLMRVLKVKCLRSIFQVLSLPTTCSSAKGWRA